MPFGPDMGSVNIRETKRCIDGMQLTDEERTRVYSGNIKKLIGK
jgi:hypothetical protein